uniref:C2 domain-containing protein n=1 Tax=Labrus bergylta TaxID=56723 RepID=A0A3Q3ECR8_9LABR
GVSAPPLLLLLLLLLTGMAQVIITVQRASGLRGDYFTSTDGYVKVFVNKVMVQRSPVIHNNNNPRWAMIVPLQSQDLSLGNKVTFQVWDKDNNWDDDLLGKCEQALSAGVKEDLCNLNHGHLGCLHRKITLYVY